MKVNSFGFSNELDSLSEECPSCGIVPFLDGPTPGCYDPCGCGEICEDGDDSSLDEGEYLDTEDDDVDELNFE